MQRPVFYATNDRLEEILAHARSVNGRIVNPKYFDGVEHTVRNQRSVAADEVSILAGSPNLALIVEEYAQHRVDVKVLSGNGAATTAPSAVPSPAAVASPAEAAPPVDTVGALPPWESTKFTPAEYLKRWGKTQTPKAELARRYVNAGRGDG